jgi:glucokinase
MMAANKGSGRTEKRMGNRRLVLGAIDIGGTKIASGLVSTSGQVLYRAQIETPAAGGKEAAEAVASLALQLQTEAGKRKFELGAVGLCVPGLVNPASGVVWAPNIKGWKNVKLLPWLQKKVDCPLSAVSDRTAYVEGEAWRGAARGKKNVIYLAVGTGIGAGLMVDGHVIHGQSDLAGAAGWLALNPEFKPAYKKVGCFEAEAGGRALYQKSKEFIQKQPEVLLSPQPRHFGTVENPVEFLCEAARAGQMEAVKVVGEIQKYLAMGVANLVSLFNPEMIVLGGGLFKSADLFFEPVKKKFKLWAQPLAAEEVEIVLSSLGQQAALLGCARSALMLLEDRDEIDKGRKKAIARKRISANNNNKLKKIKN